MIGQTVSHYHILEKLGEGGMGVVYLAEDTNLGRRVAIKFLSAKPDEHHYRARFLREARSISALSHPNIATIYEYGETEDGHPFLVMEMVNGKTLGDLLYESELTVKRAVEIVEFVAEALSEAHRHGIIHRDIKPSNVILNDRGQVKVLDFGLAKQLNEENNGRTDPDAQTLLATRTRSGVIVGTPLYLSPEQATGAAVDGRSDLFALGALLYECIAGKPAFSGGSLIEIGAQVLHIDPKPPSTFNPRVTRALDRITMKALAKKPETRYQTADEMLKDLRAARAHLSDEPHRTKRLPGTQQENMRSSALRTISDTLKRPRLSIVSLVAVIAVIAVTIGVVIWMSRPTAHKPTAEAKALYDRGTDAMRDGAYYQASKLLESAVKADDKFVLAHARLAEAWMELDYSDRAKDEMLIVGNLVPDPSALEQTDRLYLNAIRATVTRNLPDAIKSYQEIEQLTPNEAQVYVDLGRAYEKNEESDKAIESYTKATGLNPQYATAYLRVGILYSRKQEAASANSSFSKAESLYQTLGSVEGRTEVLYQRGLLQRGLGKLADARAQLQQALELARATGNELQQINALMDLSEVSFREGAIAKAQEYASEAVQFGQDRGLENLATGGLINLGRAYFLSGDYNEADKYFKQALEFSRRNKARRLEAISLMNLGSLYIKQLRTDEGLPLVQQALTFFKQGNYRRYISSSLVYIGRAHRQKGNYDAALQAFQEKLQLSQQASDQYEIALSQGEIGAVLVEQERYPEASSRYQESYTINKALGNRNIMAYSLHNQGNIQWRLGRYEDARKAFSEAFAIVSQPGSSDKSLLAEINLSEAEILLSERRFPEAIAKARQTLEEAGTQYTSVMVKAKYTLGLAQAFSGKASEGRSACEEAVEIAKGAGDAALLSRAMLALADSLYEAGEIDGALRNALQAQERFAAAGQQESEWRAWLVASRASQRKGDTSSAQEQQARAANILSQLRQKWGQETFNSYIARRDIQSSYKQVGAILAADANKPNSAPRRKENG